MKDTISVVLPTYNSAASLPNAIQSIRIQNWPRTEVIIVDDGSVDETPTVLSKLADDDIRVIRQNNGGPGAARNRGIEIANGTWVAFLDADDIWLPGKLEAQMQSLQQDPSLAFCYTDSIRRTESGAEKIQRPFRVRGNAFADLLLGPQFALSTVIVRRDCFDRVGLFAPEFRTGEDWDMWLRLAASYPSCYIPKALLVYHVSGDPNKYPLELHERCRMQIIARTLSRPEIIRRWPQVAKFRKRFYSWHYSVLAKSYLYRRRWWDFLRMGAASISSHPIGLYFLARRWSAIEHWPNLANLPSDGNPK